eukprot:gene36506-biopygen28853
MSCAEGSDVSEGGTQTIAIVGAGAKGTGIAEALTRAGRPVIVFDVDKDAAATAVRRVLAAIRRDVEAHIPQRRNARIRLRDV